MRRAVALAFALLSSAAVEHADAQSGKPHQKEGQRPNPAQPRSGSIEGAEGQRQAAARSDSEEKREQVQREERVLAAAEGATRYAGDQAALSLLGVIVAAAGTIFVIRTFQQTKAAADAANAAVIEARRSADAAEKAFAASLANAQRELRAYVGLDRAVIVDRQHRPGIFSPETVYSRSAQLTFKNYGQTPAEMFSVCWKFEITDKGKGWGDFPDDWHGVIEGWFGPGAERNVVVPFDITMHQHGLMNEGTLGLQVWYRIDFEDAFGGTTTLRNFLTANGKVYADNRFRMSGGEV